MSIEVSIIIITKNQLGILQKSIPAIKAQKSSKEFEIIVVDSGSTDGAVEYLKDQKVNLIQIKPEEFGYAKAFNIGVKKAKGKYLIRLSGDAIPANNNWLEEILIDLENPNVGAVYGKYVISGRAGYSYPDFWSADKFGNEKKIFSIKPNLGVLFKMDKVTSLAGAGYSIRKSIWDKRNFNESIISGEDAEYAFFLHFINYDIVYNPKVVLLHEHLITHDKPNLLSYLKFVGISKWQFVLVRELLKICYKRFFTNCFEDVIKQREW
ncbi:MAG: glycosyltransferase [Candidatus Shapirobacteria bacterium]|nr:glycosyltransferase [Candidatus Shapirobacteria bacterium]